MYYNGQVIFDLDKKVPVQIGNVWDTKRYPKRNTHFIETKSGKTSTPSSVKEACKLLADGSIIPEPLAEGQCEQCRLWFDRCGEMAVCSESDKNKKKHAANQLLKAKQKKQRLTTMLKANAHTIVTIEHEPDTLYGYAMRRFRGDWKFCINGNSLLGLPMNDKHSLDYVRGYINCVAMTMLYYKVHS